MDSVSLIGLILGLGAIIIGQTLEGGHISSLLQPTAFLIVVGGTVGAVLLQSPLRVFLGGVKMAKWVFMPPPSGYESTIELIVQWSHQARREGLLILERYITKLDDDPFTLHGLQMLVDGIEPGLLRESLEIENDAWATQMRQRARIWESAGGYSPTIGILGAVLGLIHVMENLSDPSKLGAGIAVAFVATVYGVGLANLILLPVHKKLLAHIGILASRREMVIDGLIGIANGDNPRIIENRMRGYIQ
ncbi:MAG: flagellar motor protein [Betaproteobacteria bacterium]|nr:flagellar motor protein [Betaproteobacteria bacterium]